MKTLIKTLNCIDLPQSQLNDQPILKPQNLTPKLQTPTELKCLKALRPDSIERSSQTADQIG